VTKIFSMRKLLTIKLLSFIFLFQIYPQNKKISYNEKIAFESAVELYVDEKYEFAQEQFRDFVFIYKDSVLTTTAYEYLAKTYIKLQFFEYAIKSYLKLIQLNMQLEHGLKFRFDLARLYLITGQPNHAKKLWQQIIQINPQSPLAHKSRLQLKLLLILRE